MCVQNFSAILIEMMPTDLQLQHTCVVIKADEHKVFISIVTILHTTLF